MTPGRPPHWLRRNEAARFPRRLVCLDSEAITTRDGPAEHHRLRCALASLDVVDRLTLEPTSTVWTAVLEPAELWSIVSDFTRTKERTVVFAHNLGYDLRLTAAMRELPRLGWQLAQFSLDSYRCWLRWRRGDATLLMVDTMSFVGRSLGAFADTLGQAKVDLPADDAPLEQWVDRCRGDVELLRALVLRLLGWLERGDHGNFRMTGPAQASASYRHRFLDERRLLVHSDKAAIEAERVSAYAGRCEVWRHGQVAGPLQEWDFSLAYARVARDAQLPVRYRGTIERPKPSRLRDCRRSFAVLAEVDVDTAAPIVPTGLDGRILWPTGRFRSTLWDCELDLLDEHGAHYTVRRVWLYGRAPLLKRWAEWIISQLEDADGERCEVARAVLKLWSRSLIGRFGLRYPRWETAGTTPDEELLLLPYLDGPTGERGTYLRLGRQLLEQAGVEESRDSAPAIMAWIMARARVRLWRAMQAAGLENVVYVDTDAIVTAGLGSQWLHSFAETAEGEGLRLKRRHSSGLLRAPRQVVFGDEARIAGLPRSARAVGPFSYRAQVWEGPSEAIRRRRPNEVVVTERTIVLRAPDRRRQHLPRGATAAYQLPLDPGTGVKYTSSQNGLHRPESLRGLSDGDRPAVDRPVAAHLL